MRVLLVTGSYPPDICGVGDYTSCLAQALCTAGVDLDVLTGQNWSASKISQLVRRVNSYRADIVHLQYPTVGFGHKLGPHLLSTTLPVVTTIHELTQAHLLRKLSLYWFSLRSRRIVFTTESERDYAIRWCPWIRGKEALIAVGSNIQVSDRTGERENVIGYFGLIRPMKGLEQVIDAASLLHARGSDLRVRIIGKPPRGREGYYTKLREKSVGLPIDWHATADDAEIPRLIASCKFAYLPFPDGASERRASLIAFLEAGGCIVTTRGDQTPRFMEGAMKFSRSPEEAIEIIYGLKDDPEMRSELEANAIAVARRFSWQQIALEHVKLYDSLLRQNYR